MKFPATCAYWFKYQPEKTVAGIGEAVSCDEAKTRLDNAHKDYEDFLRKKTVEPPLPGLEEAPAAVGTKRSKRG